MMGRGGGQVVSVLAFNSDHPSSNPAEVYKFSVKLLLKRTKISKKRPGWPILKKLNHQYVAASGRHGGVNIWSGWLSQFVKDVYQRRI